MSDDVVPARWLTGCYTADGDGTGAGIGRLASRDDRSVEWLGDVATTPSPSFLARHPTLPVVYAVAEFEGVVRAFSDDGQRLEQLGDAIAVGEVPCHVAVDPRGRFAVVSCYGDGRVVALPLDAAGRLGAPVAGEPSTDPYDQDRPSRAHCALMVDDRVLTADLGHDAVRQWRWSDDEAGLVEAADPVVLPIGSGPRHLARHPSGSVLVVTEYSIEVALLTPRGEAFALGSIGPATAHPAAEGDAGAHITVTDDGRFAHVTVRGSNRVSTLAVDGPTAVPVRDVACGGDWPRHHVVAGGILHVANQLSGDIATFALGAHGVPGSRVSSTPVATPTCIIPV